MTRPRCSAFIATSLDGYIARRDGRIDWLSTVERPGEDYGYQRFFDSIDALVIGRKTYEAATGFDTWPYAGKRCVVLTGSPRAPMHGESFHGGDVRALVDALGAEGVQRVYVDGGATIRSFLDAERLDDITISIVPMVLGEGIRLFEDPTRSGALVLAHSEAFASGLVQLEYRVQTS